MSLPNKVKCPICGENMPLADPRVAKAVPFLVVNPNTGKESPPDETAVRICMKCGNVQQFVLIRGFEPA